MSNTPEAPARRHKYRAAIGAGAIAGVAITALWVVTAPAPAEIGGRKVAQATQSATEASKSSPAATSASPFSAEQKAAIEKIVTEYLIANPEFLMEIQNSLEAKMEKLQSEKLKVALKDNAKDIFKRASAPMAGNPNGDITVVEFFDYNCGYCKRAFGDLARVIDRDKQVKDLYPKFELDLKENIVEYGRTLRSLKDNEQLVFKVKMTACKGCGIPATLELSIPSSALKDYGTGKATREATVAKISVKKTGVQ